jgi:nucleotide-binding universal stress UspA family protein
MYKHILVPTDGSELSRKAIEHGIALAKSVNSKVTAVTVTVPFHVFSLDLGMATNTPEQFEKCAAEMAAKDLGVAKEAAKANGISCDTIRVEHESPHRAIIDTAAQNSCDLIVMASHGRRGISAIVLGSETLKVLTHSMVPVLVIRAPQMAFASRPLS